MRPDDLDAVDVDHLGRLAPAEEAGDDEDETECDERTRGAALAMTAHLRLPLGLARRASIAAFIEGARVSSSATARPVRALWT